MKKIISIFLALSVLLNLFNFQNDVSASSIQEDSKVKQYLISHLVDNEDVKELLILYPEDNSYYKIEAVKRTNGTYTWTTTIGDKLNVYSSNNFIVNEFSTNFSMQTLAEIIVEAEQENIKQYYDENVNFLETTPIQPRVVPLIAIGVYGLSATAIAAIEAAMVGTLAVATAAAVSDILNEKKSTSTTTYPAETSPITLPNWSQFTGFSTATTTSGVKHMESALVTTIANRIKNNNNNNNNLQIFTSSLNVKNSVMIVYDVTTSTSGKVNRHLGNFVGGTKKDSTIADETLDLNGYTVFLSYNHTTKKLFHAHFVPTTNRAKELTYNRYRFQYDIQIFPNFSRNQEYLTNNGRTATDQLKWEQRSGTASTNRKNTLLKDSNGNYSVVPKK